MKFNYGLSDTYDSKYECEDYVGFLYKIKYTDKIRGIYEPDDNQKDSSFVSATQNKQTSTVARDHYKVPEGYKMLPLMRQNCTNSKNIQRDVVVITASSGSGKTTLITRMCQLYRGLNPNNKILFVSSKNMAKDPSFNSKLYSFIPFSEFMEEFTEEFIKEFETNNLMDNTLVVFDDIVLSAITKEQKEIKDRFFKFLAVVLNLKRMNYLSLIYCCHETSDYGYTRLLFNEMTVYITFNTDLKNRSNLIFKDYLKLNKNEIERITSANSRWVAILTRPRAILTENEIMALN